MRGGDEGIINPTGGLQTCQVGDEVSGRDTQYNGMAPGAQWGALPPVPPGLWEEMMDDAIKLE